MLLAKDLLMASGGGDFPTDPVRFDYTGTVQTYTVPKGCRALDIDCVGAKGGDDTGKFNSTCYSDGGKGGRVQCRLSVSPNQTLYVYVGGKPDTVVNTESSLVEGGWNGGGGTLSGGGDAMLSGGGGGASDIRTVQASANSWYDTAHSSWDTDSSLLSRLVVAGAGGGSTPYGAGCSGQGGGLIGGAGINTGVSPTDTAYGGTQTSGGTATGGSPGYDGYFGKGGDNFPNKGNCGGGGWYGGAGGNYGATGGGSSYTHPTLCSDVVHTQGYSEAIGNGWIIITPVK